MRELGFKWDAEVASSLLDRYCNSVYSNSCGIFPVIYTHYKKVTELHLVVDCGIEL